MLLHEKAAKISAAYAKVTIKTFIIEIYLQNKMLKQNWKKVIFAIAIALLYIPMVYLGINTFFPDTPTDRCYEAVPVPRCLPEDEGCLQKEQLSSKERQDCYDKQQQEKREYEGKKYIVLMIICLLTSLIMLTKIEQSVIYGLFFGVVITAFTGTIRYIDSKSMIGFFLMVALFLIIILFVQRFRKK